MNSRAESYSFLERKTSMSHMKSQENYLFSLSFK